MLISLRPVSPGDLAIIDRWAGDIAVDNMSRTRPHGEGADRHDPASGLFWYLVSADDLEVGTVWIELHTAPSEAVLGVFLGDAGSFDRGIGTEAIGLAMTEFRRVHPQQPITLRVRQSNARAIACYRRAGFIVTGTGSKLLPSGELLPFFRMVSPPG